MQIFSISSTIVSPHPSVTLTQISPLQFYDYKNNNLKKHSIQCLKKEEKEDKRPKKTIVLRTCKQCKAQFDPSLNHPNACRFHSAHFGGETKRKFESVYSGGTMNTSESGKVFQYWHCCGSEDPFDPGCTASPHSSYDD
uniref:uncharacterized protein LOC122579805 n=1 Tax=Erigeron canadensis TaxID=72917 RepID=UPI001CB9587B|nr:uncharacterized protein LOC122579805 [Erigeron canadensis]